MKLQKNQRIFIGEAKQGQKKDHAWLYPFEVLTIKINSRGIKVLRSSSEGYSLVTVLFKKVLWS